MEHQYLLTLKGTDGKSPGALLRLKQGKAGYQAERRDYTPLPREAAVWLFTPAGPVPMEEAKPGPVLGAALVEGGRCLSAGAVKGARIDLPGELLRLRLLLHTEQIPLGRPGRDEGQGQPEPDPPVAEIESAEEPIEEATEEAAEESVPEAVQEECMEASAEGMAEEEEPTAEALPPEEATVWDDAPSMPAMMILPKPEETEDCGCDGDADKESDMMLCSISGDKEESREEWHEAQQIHDHVPEGADEVSGREYGWNSAEEEERRAIWFAEKLSVEYDAEYNVNLGERETEDISSPESRSGALQEILARAERTFSDHVPPSPTPVLTEGMEVVAGAPADPVQAREGLSMAIPNPFPNTFPGAEFRRVHRPQGQGWYLEGEMRRGNERWRITAMPGEYRPIPPCALQGFHRYIKSRDGGYWVRIERG